MCSGASSCGLDVVLERLLLGLDVWGFVYNLRFYVGSARESVAWARRVGVRLQLGLYVGRPSQGA